MYRGIRRIPWMKGFISHILPLVYDDSLSYYEFLMKLTNKINEVVEDINKISSDLGKYIGDYITSPEFREYLEEILSEDFLEEAFKNYSDTINVLDFGVDNTGVDSTVEMMAVKAAFEADTNKAKIYFPEGKYSFKADDMDTSYIWHDRDVEIWGEHAKFTPIQVAVDQAVYYTMFIFDRCNVKFHGTILCDYNPTVQTPQRGYMEWRTAFEFRYCNEVKFYDNHCENINCFAYGGNSKGWLPSDPIAKRKNLWMKAWNCNRVYFFDNELTDASGEEIAMICTDNTITGYDFGDGEYFVYNNSFHDNRKPDHTGSALCVVGGTLDFHDNIAENFDYFGSIFNLFANKAYIHDNIITDCSANAIDTCEYGRVYNESVVIRNNSIDLVPRTTWNASARENACNSIGILTSAKRVVLDGNDITCFTPIRTFANGGTMYKTDVMTYFMPVLYSNSVDPTANAELIYLSNNNFNISPTPTENALLEYTFLSGCLSFGYSGVEYSPDNIANLNRLVMKHNKINSAATYSGVTGDVPRTQPRNGISLIKQPRVTEIIGNWMDCIGVAVNSSIVDGYRTSAFVGVYNAATLPANCRFLFANNILSAENMSSSFNANLCVLSCREGNTGPHIIWNNSCDYDAPNDGDSLVASDPRTGALTNLIFKNNTMRTGGQDNVTPAQMNTAISSALEDYPTNDEMVSAISTATSNSPLIGDFISSQNNIPSGNSYYDFPVTTPSGYRLINALVIIGSSALNVKGVIITGNVVRVFVNNSNSSSLGADMLRINPIFTKN